MSEGLSEVARKLYGFGLNVVPICSDKKPCTSWSPESRMEWKEIERLLPKAEAVAVVGGPIEGEEYYLVPIDIDDPDVAHEVMSQVWGEGWLKTLCSSQWALCVKTGPRPKHQVQCEGDVCHAPNGDVPASQVKRGLAVIVRVPRRCAPQSSVRKGSIEVLAKNYQLVAGRHPSGLQYELLSPQYGPGELVSCEELHRLIALLNAPGEAVQQAPPGPVGCKTWRQLSDDDKDLLLQALKPLWLAVDSQGGHYHDRLTFAVASVAARNCIAYEDIYAVFVALLEWAKASGIDSERDVQHHLSVVDWVYGRGAARGTIWGFRRLSEVVEEAASAVGEDPKQILAMVQTAIGFEPGGKSECIAVRYAVGEGGSKPTGLLCNEKGRGVFYISKEKPKKRKKKKGGEEEKSEEGEEEEKRESWNKLMLVNAWLETAVKYRDVLLDIVYISSVVGTPEGRLEFPMVRLEEFVKRVSEFRQPFFSVDWSVILTSGKYPLVEDAVVSGFVCDPSGKIKCGVRDYFNVGIVQSPDLGKARRALELLDQAAQLHPNPTRFMAAVALASFTAFSFTQRRFNVRPKMPAAVGPAQTGKTQVGRILNAMFTPNINTVYSVGRVFTPARLGRMLSTNHVLTTPVTLDEAYLLFTRPELTEILKHYVSSKDYAWETAHGQKWPATPGLFLTANMLEVNDPAIEDKLVIIEFPTQISPQNKQRFHELLKELSEALPHLGGYYLKYAEEHWEEAKRLILDSAVENWEQAAVDYFLLVARQLGYIPQPLADVQFFNVMHSSLKWVYLERLLAKAREWAPQACRDVSSMANCIERLVEHGYLSNVIKLLARNDGEYYILREVFGLPTEALCEELGGFVNKGKTAPFGNAPNVYGKCVVPKDVFLSLFDSQIVEEGGA